MWWDVVVDGFAGWTGALGLGHCVGSGPRRCHPVMDVLVGELSLERLANRGDYGDKPDRGQGRLGHTLARRLALKSKLLITLIARLTVTSYLFYINIQFFGHLMVHWPL